MRRYLTTTLPYVNADPHVGFALEIIQADTLARHWRLMGDEVFFNTGSDEHGQKIFEAAQKAGKEVKDYVDHYAGEFEKLKEALNLSHDAFIRTTDEKHVHAAQEMWKRCEAAGDIYKKSYTGLYCVGCESYKTEKDLVDGKCSLHPNQTPEEITEENYFFRFKNYEKKLLEHLSSEAVIVPKWRREEAIAFVKGGLEDFSISREKVRLSWGVPVPGDDAQVMYVWFDALTNYISTLGWPDGENFQKFWNEGKVIQVAGKDQVRFQTLIFQAMLMSAGVKNTDQIFYHGFITSGGQKMSKSLGNVISPYELVKKYDTDATRYLLLRHVHPTEDSDVTWEKLDEWYTANLVNGLGNLVARVMKLAEQYLQNPVLLTTQDVALEAPFLERLNAYRFNEAVDLVFEHIARGDAYITEREPYKKAKDLATKEEGVRDIEKLVRHVAKIAAHLAPMMPATSVAIQEAVRENRKPRNLFPRLTAGGVPGRI